jgi:hypothetical protein
MATDWLLVHPPLLGPAVLGPLAAELRRRGLTVAVPDLRPAVAEAPGWPERWVAAAVDARRVVWVDALVPARSGETPADDDIRARIPALVEPDGRITYWTTWWGPGGLDELVPDAGLRTAIRAEGHRLPGNFYDVAVPVPDTWPEDGARYVQLSPAYDDAAAEARARGWSVVGGPGGAHLDIATDPSRVADLLG